MALPPAFAKNKKKKAGKGKPGKKAAPYTKGPMQDALASHISKKKFGK